MHYPWAQMTRGPLLAISECGLTFRAVSQKDEGFHLSLDKGERPVVSKRLLYPLARFGIGPRTKIGITTAVLPSGNTAKYLHW